MEYRIKATSAEHRKAIIGALKGLGLVLESEEDDDYKQYPAISIDMHNKTFDFDERTDNLTHTSLDTLIADIIRDRQTVELKLGGFPVKVDTNGITMGDIENVGATFYLTFSDFDRIAEAVKKVRG